MCTPGEIKIAGGSPYLERSGGFATGKVGACLHGAACFAHQNDTFALCCLLQVSEEVYVLLNWPVTSTQALRCVLNDATNVNPAFCSKAVQGPLRCLRYAISQERHSTQVFFEIWFSPCYTLEEWCTLGPLWMSFEEDVWWSHIHEHVFA